MAEPDLITVARAIEIIDSVSLAPQAVKMQLADAQGMHLAGDILADRDYPPFDKSLMDGVAVRCADVVAAPVQLVVQGEIAAGQPAAAPLKPGHAYAIMTGAPMPPGADGVVPVEETESLDDGRRVRIVKSTSPGKFIMHKGGDCPAGTVVLNRGTRLEAPQLAVAASVGASIVQVYARPRVAVLSTGDELVAVDATPGDAQIRNSNNIMLVSLLRKLGCDVTDLGTAPDQPGKIRAAIERGLECDALLVTGGMSMGRYDFVPKILIELGCDLKITKLRIKPGKPFVFATIRDRFVFGLPGNPVSGYVCTLRLASRLLVRMLGGTQFAKVTSVKTNAPIEPNGNREFYQPGILGAGELTPLKWKGSADIYTLARANGLIIRPENAPAASAGDLVEVLEMPV